MCASRTLLLICITTTILALAAGNGPTDRVTKQAPPTQKGPLKLVQALITSKGVPNKKGMKLSTTPSSPRKMNIGTVASVSMMNPALDNPTKTTEFDYPDIVENVALPEGMFETDRESNEIDSDEIMFKPAVEPQTQELVHNKKPESIAVTAAPTGKGKSKGPKKGKSPRTTTTKSVPKGKLQKSTTTKKPKIAKNKPAVEPVKSVI